MKNIIIVLWLFILTFLVSYTKENIETVTIGSQVWMKKNLNIDHYRNGDSIPEVRDSATWANSKTGAWCYYNNNSDIGKVFGKLYNWYALNDLRGLVPIGWHIPTSDEWTTLITFLGSGYVNISYEKEDWAGGKLKDTGTTHWLFPNKGATNESNFCALPGGFRQEDGGFIDIKNSCYIWSASVHIWPKMEDDTLEGSNIDTVGVYIARLYYEFSAISLNYYGMANGFSIRCIKDK